MKTQKNNNGFDKLNGVGTKNSRNVKRLETTMVNSKVGVVAFRDGEKKATCVELVVPTRRTSKGSRTTARVCLNGVQARSVYETLKSYYEV